MYKKTIVIFLFCYLPLGVAKQTSSLCSSDKEKNYSECINQTLEKESKKAEDERATYLNAAIKRINETYDNSVYTSIQPPTKSVLIKKIEDSDKKFKLYREDLCGSVLDYWSAGTISGSKYYTCYIGVTKNMTMDIWKNYLTYDDSTPPLLPEPKR